MRPKAEWMQILVECKDKVQRKIGPLLKTLDQQQLSLGIGAGGDPVRQIDLAAEKATVNTLKDHKVTFTLVSEESGIVEYGEEPRQCYVTIDPIDGTTNLMREMPFYATSIAVSGAPNLSTVHTALVADLVHGTTYVAQKGCGAKRDFQKITPSVNTSIEEGVIGIDLDSYRIRKIAPKLTSLIGKTKHIRHFGANALELCYVADGRSDAFIDIRGKLRTTDVAAAWLIIKEAGAMIVSSEGKALDAKLDPKEKVKFIAAANADMLGRILYLLKSKKEK